MKVWVNGTFTDAEGVIDARERGVLLGDGLFETLAVVDARPLRLARHLQRLHEGAASLGIPLSHDTDMLVEAITGLCRSESISEGAARITLLRGPAPRGILPPETPSPTLMIGVAPGTVGAGEPLSAIIASSTRRNDQSPLAAIKSTNYLDAILAMREARDAGADDALLLNTRDHLAEATAANVFCSIEGELVTPPVADGALPGIMRACVMACETVRERSLSDADVRQAEEIFLTSSLSIRPVIAVDGLEVGNGLPGPVAARLRDLPRHAR